jgi:xanthine dehydrogenase iron-sulfur cluster and FAD-binding subunit A
VADVHVPSSLDEVFRLLGDEPSATLFAGGTDVMVRSSPDMRERGPFLCLERVEELRGIHGSATEVRIGAATTLSEVSRALSSRTFFPFSGRLCGT